MFQKVIKLGRSVCVVIPRGIALGLEIQRGDIVSVHAIASNTVQIRLYDPSEMQEIKRNHAYINDETIKL